MSKIKIEAQIARCGADARVTGFHVQEDPERLIAECTVPDVDGQLVSRAVFRLDMLPGLLASGHEVLFVQRVHDVGAFDFAFGPHVGCREYDVALDEP